VPEVARRCLECGIEARDLIDGQETERDTPRTRRQRVKDAAVMTAIVTLGVVIGTLATIGCLTLWFTTAFMWPWLPWA